MTLVLRFAAGSHKGLIREGNEDSGYAGPRLLAVADGMGGAAAGEVASSEVVGSIVRLDEQAAAVEAGGVDLLSLLGDAVQGANDRLRQMVEQDSKLEGMGCTLTALLWTGQRMGMAHIGDSRAYLLRDGSLAQITQDHTWVQRLVDEGRITPEEAETHPQRSLLMRALDGRGQVEPDLSIREVRAGDRYLICSDGLSGPVSHQTLEETLSSFYAPQQTVQELIQLALRGGGPDNITCIVADVIDVGPTDPYSAQYAEAPVVVGAVAEAPPHTIADPNFLNTPAAHAAGLGTPHGAFGPADGYQQGFGPAQGYGEGYPEGGFSEPAYGEYGSTEHAEHPDPHDEADDERPERRKGGGLKFSLITLVVLGLLGSVGYFGYQWTQDQYYVGSDGDSVAVFRGINQNLAGLTLHSRYEQHSDIELKYLPSYQRDQVNKTIPAKSLDDAHDQIKHLSDQAAVCKKLAQAKSGSVPAAFNMAPAGTTPTSGSTPSLNEQEQQLAPACPQ